MAILRGLDHRAHELSRVGVAFPCSKWSEVRNRPEFARPAAYILVGYGGEDGGTALWQAIRIAGGMLEKIRHIAAAQSRPVPAIMHYAPVDRIGPNGDSGKYKGVFSEPAKRIDPIPFGDAPSGAMQGPRYTSFEKLKSAKTVSDIFRPTRH